VHDDYGSLSGRSRCRRAPMKTTSRPPMTRGSSPCRSVFPKPHPRRSTSRCGPPT